MDNGFRIIMRFHTPLIMPVATPRLDILLHEALCRLHQDWTAAHELPLEKDSATGVYCGSQLIPAVTPSKPMVASSEKLVTAVFRQDLHLARNTKRRFGSQVPDGNKLTSHQGISIPYGLFYGVGDADQCAALLSLLGSMGREHARHYGSFTVERLESTDAPMWRLRPWPIDYSEGWAPCREKFVEDHLALLPSQSSVPVMRPPRLMREVLHAS